MNSQGAFALAAPRRAGARSPGAVVYVRGARPAQGPTTRGCLRRNQRTNGLAWHDVLMDLESRAALVQMAEPLMSRAASPAVPRQLLDDVEVCRVGADVMHEYAHVAKQR
jgi:hypothetical protein